jgi:hypothetical protein
LSTPKKVTASIASKLGKTPAPKVKTPPVLTNHVVIVLDASPSMSSIRTETIKMFNDTVEKIKATAAAEKQNTTVGLVLFGHNLKPVDVRYMGAPVATLKPFTSHDFRPQDGNGTPMFDGVGAAIEQLSLLPKAEHKDTSFLCIVLTDGQENMSTTYDKVTLPALMKKKNSTDRWTFAYLVPTGEKANLVNLCKIPAGNVQEWDTTAEGMEQASKSLGSSIAAYGSSRTLGVRASKSFFVQTDLSKLSKKDLAKLTDIRNDVKVLTVAAEAEIQPFVQDKLNTVYMPGQGFYQLMKTEEVHQNKAVLIMDKATKAIYGGKEARSLIGLPEDKKARVHVGNHDKYEIFIQSMSNNRKLPRGTKLAYIANRSAAFGS